MLSDEEIKEANGIVDDVLAYGNDATKVPRYCLEKLARYCAELRALRLTSEEREALRDLADHLRCEVERAADAGVRVHSPALALLERLCK